jgi:hypothetical protein
VITVTSGLCCERSCARTFEPLPNQDLARGDLRLRTQRQA